MLCALAWPAGARRCHPLIIGDPLRPALCDACAMRAALRQHCSRLGALTTKGQTKPPGSESGCAAKAFWRMGHALPTGIEGRPRGLKQKEAASLPKISPQGLVRPDGSLAPCGSGGFAVKGRLRGKCPPFDCKALTGPLLMARADRPGDQPLWRGAGLWPAAGGKWPLLFTPSSQARKAVLVWL